jgi:hypothetical protein
MKGHTVAGRRSCLAFAAPPWRSGGHRLRSALAGLALLLAAAAAPSPVAAQTFYTLNMGDLVPQSVASDGCFYDYIGGKLGHDEGADPCCVVAPVHLPDGVTVGSVLFWLLDDSASDFTMSLRRKASANTVPSSIMATVTTSGSSANVRFFLDPSISDAVIDNSAYTYFVSSDTCLDDGFATAFFSALIDY